ncbi:MAG: cytochrome b6-f complex iron-sulfur subunit [Verrucomicrobiales bacterium]|jgi:cytochrome b6-f complex iron-sulfur subunit
MTAAAISAIVALVLLAAILLFASSRRKDSDVAISELSAETRRRDRDRERVKASVSAAAAESGLTGKELERSTAIEQRGGAVVPVDDSAIEPWVAPDPEVVGVARRQFLNRAIIAVFGLNLTGFGLAVIAQLWPGASEGFGSEITVGPVTDVLNEIRAGGGFLYRPEGRMWITEFPLGALEKAAPVYASTPAWPGIEAGVKALYQKCPHLGCRVPDCGSSQYFECPCHGSFYNQVGEKRGGPAPRGMDFFAMSVDGGVLKVNTGNIVGGPAIGTNTTGQEREGPSCLGASSH